MKTWTLRRIFDQDHACRRRDIRREKLVVTEEDKKRIPFSGVSQAQKEDLQYESVRDIHPSIQRTLII